MDMDFYPVASKMSHVTVNMAEAPEHMREIEIYIRAVKECG